MVQEIKTTIDKEKTIQNILDKINSSNGFSIDIQKFNIRKDDQNFLKEATKFVGVQVEYL